jgi:signal transduction histidine kinase
MNGYALYTQKFVENASRKKTEFMAHMSHELRTPLAAISGIAEIFDSAPNMLDEKYRKLVKVLVSSTAALKDLLNDIDQQRAA